MTSMTTGTLSPVFQLADTSGKNHNIKEIATEKGTVILAFYKASCPVCQMTAPFLERIARMNPELALYGISQDDKGETRNFIDEYKISFPVLLDKELKITRAYELTNVPSIFVLNQDLKVDKSIVGFSKEDLEYIHRIQESPDKKPLFTDSDDVPDFRPG